MSRTSQYTFETVGTTSRRLPPPKNPKDARHLRFRNRNSPTASSCPKTVTARLRLLRARRAPTASVAWSRASSGIESGVDGLPRGLRRFSSRCIPRGRECTLGRISELTRTVRRTGISPDPPETLGRRRRERYHHRYYGRSSSSRDDTRVTLNQRVQVPNLFFQPF